MVSYHDNDQSQPLPPQQLPQPLPLLSPGFRFYPTEEELVCFYLRNKLQGLRTQEMERFIPVVEVYRYEPHQLPQMSGESNIHDPEQWFFFCPRQEREAQGGRPTRITPSGYWKATGSPTDVYSSSLGAAAAGHGHRPAHGPIAVKKTMVFYEGRAPQGTRTVWKMNEYRAIDATPLTPPKLRKDFSICRVYIKSNSLRSFDRRPSAANQIQAAGGVGRDGSNWPRVEPLSLPLPLVTSTDGSSDNNDPEPWGGDVNLRMLQGINWDCYLEPFLINEEKQAGLGQSPL